METMDDFKDELEASFRQIREGDIITGTVRDHSGFKILCTGNY